MRHIKTLAATAAATALLAAIGVTSAQTTDSNIDPMATPQEAQRVDVNANPSGQQIYFFRDQGNSPETDPAAHLLLIKHEQPAVPVASTTTTTTTVAQATTTDPVTTVMPAAADTSNTETAAAPTPAPVDTAEPALAPKADRN